MSVTKVKQKTLVTAGNTILSYGDTIKRAFAIIQSALEDLVYKRSHGNDLGVIRIDKTTLLMSKRHWLCLLRIE